MKLSKQQEKELLKAYNSYWESYLKGDVKTMAGLLAKEYTQVGSAESEVFSSRKDAVQFLRDTIHEVAGKLEMRNRIIKPEQQDRFILVHENCDLYALTGKKWVFYSKFRASSLMQEKKGGWKFIHQHSSFPDTKAEEGQNIAIDKIAKENLRLKEAVKRRTVELEQTNRELEIETALEKVRAIAMGMKEPADMLQVCKTISLQLNTLGIKETRNVQTAIFYEEKGTYMNYEYYAKHDKTIITETSYTNNEMHQEFATQMLKGKGEFFSRHIKGKKKVADWLAYQRTTNVFIDTFLETAKSLSYYWFSLGPVALGISTYVSLSEEGTGLFKRFLKVFELSYRRYLDIEKAEEQAKEAKIEASLERVRAVAMSMMKSDELLNVSEVLIKEFKALGFQTIRNAQIDIFNDSKKTYLNYECDAGNLEKTITEVAYDSHPLVQSYLETIKSSKDAFFVHTIKEKDFDSWKSFVKTTGYTKNIIPKGATSLVYYNYSIGVGSLGISTYGSLDESSIIILKRFRNVFELAYRRYSDVAQAEGQAKEVQIELALERVRARTMAMQQSEELPDAANLLFQQMQALGMPAWSAGYCIWDDDKRGITLWMSSEGVMQPSFHMPLTVDPSLIHMREANERHESFHMEAVGGPELIRHYKYMRTLPGIGEVLDSIINAGHPLPTFQIFHCAYFSQGFLMFITYEAVPEAHDIFKRFGKVFDQTYTRFLDLQKAEAQTREAQIETALEKVRSRSLAMHNSLELNDVVTILFEKLKELQIPATAAGIGIYSNASKDMSCYVCGENIEGLVVNTYRLPYFNNKICEDFYHSYEEQLEFFVGHYSKKEKNNFYEFVLQQTELKFLPDDVKSLIMKSDSYTISMFPVKHAVFNINDFEGKVLSEGQINILKRFAKVFEQAYTRFLDLQKAEAQTREAQIEAALERVRSKTMAMHKSDELLQVVMVLADQLTQLDFRFDNVSFGENNQEGDFKFWFIAAGQSQPLQIQVPYKDNPAPNRVKEAQKKGVKFFADILSKEENREWTQHLIDHSPVKFFPDKVKDYILNSVGYARSTSVLKNINLYIGNYKAIAYTEEENNLFQRFAQVFEQSYTRFLDLKKAEAQAREAQIEAALEKVRSRSLAMHKSEELREVVSVVFEKLQELDFLMDDKATGILIFKEGTKDHIQWIADPGHSYPTYFNNPYTEHPLSKDLIDAKESGADYFAKLYSFEEKNDFFDYLFQHTDYRVLPEEVKNLILATKSYGFSVAFAKNSAILVPTNSGKLLSDTEKEIIKRFAKVFEQSYTRFLDLQKAEAQAREAQIEAALERTRTQSMIMQHSNELDDTLRVFHEQVLLLGIKSAFSFLWLPDEENDRHIFWAAWAENNSTVFKSKAIDYPLDRNEPATKQCLIDWKGNDPVVSYHVAPAFVKDYFAAWSELITGVEELKPENFEDGLYYVEAFMKYGCFGVIVKNALSDEENKILDRFAVEFERAYTRFLDLQKAESQTKESQIQLALERVRARTMAMQHSDELPDAANILFQQMQTLGMPAWSAGYCIWDDDRQAITLWMSSAGIIQKPFRAPVTEDPSFIHFYGAYKRGEAFYVETIGGDEIGSHYQYMLQLPVVGEMLNQFIANGGSLPAFQIFHLAFFSQGFLLFITYEPVPEAHDIFKRFGNVFDQTYTRFLDLLKAEAQAREAQIQLALERVRARTMAMQRSDELADVAELLFKQVKDLGIKSWTTGFNVWSEDNNFYTDYITNPQGGFVTPYTIDARSLPVGVRLSNAKKSGQQFYVNYEEGEALAETYRTLLKFGEKQFTSILESGFDFPTSQYEYFVFGARVSLMFITYDAVPEAQEIFKRFGKVFEQTYTRFLDLQNAESQARESQIELSLERVRAKTMAMHNSQDVGDTVAVMFDEVMKLGIETIRCGIGIMHEPGEMEIWTAKPDENGKVDLIIGRMDMMIHPLLQGAFEGWRNKQEFYTYELTGGDLIDYFTAINNHSGYPVKYDIASLPSKIFHSEFHFAEGTLFVFSLEKLSAEASKIFKRFSGVFGQTYRRYLDLKKAEAQMREAQIEAALERVRSRTMAMHKGNELADTAMLLFDQLISLGIKPRSCGFLIMDENSRTMDDWSANMDGQGKSTIVTGKLDFDQHPILAGVAATWQKGEPYYIGSIHGEELQKYYEMVTAKQTSSADIKENVLAVSTSEYTSSFFFQYGMMYVLTPVQLTEHEINVMLRFASVFRLTYTRFLDLQRAETQAREATIEAALEKVRGKAMAMHTSNDLSATASMVFTELRKLGITPIRSGVGILNKESRKAQLYSATSSSSGDSLSLVGWIMLTKHPVAEKIYDSWMMGEDYYPELIGEQLKSYYENLLSGLSLPSIPDWKDGQKQFGTFLSFSVGCLYAWSENPYNDDEIKILKRFGLIIDLTFRRYIELQKSEASAKEAVKQASLDRVRAEIASMRTTNDLERITPLIWNELTILGVAFIRCGVFIMDEVQQVIHTFLSTPDGKAIGAFHLPYTTQGNMAEVLRHWQQKENYITHWNESDFTEFADMLAKQNSLSSSEQYLQTIPHSGFHLHFLPFLQGMLYVGNTRELGEEEIKLVQSVANAFSTAYARYEDFNKLESAKQTVEKTLVDLRQAQTQLVQAEKMASLGQLTAGIAHEIQNPLNFVNNFSEVSEELIKEMLEEVNKGNIDEVKAIAGDLVQNLGKINHHGKRADSIVKGMLEHSRTSTGNMEPTDINALADEYLRLSYHGIRAKDKSFNTAIHTDFDTTINKINIIGQDIGRVLLNLYNNSFYAVNEKKKQLTTGYEPAVSVTTKKTGDAILISVKDNGNGIPQNIVDKIFQPFFTTKPTGSGTGLGLSLAYDIVKAHGGEIKVETKEGEGSTFIILLSTK